MDIRTGIDAGNRPLITPDGYMDRAALVALCDEIMANARERGARMSDDDAWRLALAAAHELWAQMYQERVTA